jgi:hypothetical protein
MMETETGHDLIRPLSSAPGHVIAAVGEFAVFTNIAARDGVAATYCSIRT